MTTAQEIFDSAMILMDEVDETTGKTDTADTKEYKNRTLGILNILAKELYQYSDTYRENDAGFRPVPPTIKRFDTNIPLDDFICDAIMPYGLAAHLLRDEDPDGANFFQQRYEELKREAKDIPAESEDITDLYGGMQQYQNFGKWGG